MSSKLHLIAHDRTRAPRRARPNRTDDLRGFARSNPTNGITRRNEPGRLPRGTGSDRRRGCKNEPRNPGGQPPREARGHRFGLRSWIGETNPAIAMHEKCTNEFNFQYIRTRAPSSPPAAGGGERRDEGRPFNGHETLLAFPRMPSSRRAGPRASRPGRDDSVAPSRTRSPPRTRRRSTGYRRSARLESVPRALCP